MSPTKKLVIFSLLLLALPVAVFAAGNQVDQSIQINKDEIVDGNLIKVGNIINIEGAVKGDVILAGNSIRISGPVAGDVIVAGNSVRILGPVEGSVRVVGSTVEITGEVKHNVWVAGSSVVLAKESLVGWDVFAAAGSVEIRGKVGGNVSVGTGTLVVSNEIGKNLTTAADAEGQVILESGAKINGDLTYKAARDEQLVIKEGATVAGKTERQALSKGHQADRKDFGPVLFLFKIISFFGLLIVGLALVTLIPKKLLVVKDEMIKRPARSLGWGLVYLVVTPVIVVLLMFTVIGIPLAIVIVPLYLVVLYLSKVLAGLALGTLAVDWLTKNKYHGSLIWPLALGLLILIVVSSLPIFGWLIGLLITLWAFGAVIQVKKDIIAEWR